MPIRLHGHMVLPQRVELCVRAYKARPQDRRGQGVYNAPNILLERFHHARLLLCICRQNLNH